MNIVTFFLSNFRLGRYIKSNLWDMHPYHRPICVPLSWFMCLPLHASLCSFTKFDAKVHPITPSPLGPRACLCWVVYLISTAGSHGLASLSGHQHMVWVLQFFVTTALPLPKGILSTVGCSNCKLLSFNHTKSRKHCWRTALASIRTGHQFLPEKRNSTNLQLLKYLSDNIYP